MNIECNVETERTIPQGYKLKPDWRTSRQIRQTYPQLSIQCDRFSWRQSTVVSYGVVVATNHQSGPLGKSRQERSYCVLWSGTENRVKDRHTIIYNLLFIHLLKRFWMSWDIINFISIYPVTTLFFFMERGWVSWSWCERRQEKRKLSPSSGGIGHSRSLTEL